MSYYNAFKRSTDDKTRHCQQEETHNFASSENSNNVEPKKWQKPTRDYGFIQNWIINYVWYKETKKLHLFMASSKSYSVKGLPSYILVGKYAL